MNLIFFTLQWYGKYFLLGDFNARACQQSEYTPSIDFDRFVSIYNGIKVTLPDRNNIDNTVYTF